MSDKIQPHHLERKAILYVRQSSAHQVQHNRESRALQYAIRLLALGWSEIETINADLGRSAAGGVSRAGFLPGIFLLVIYRLASHTNFCTFPIHILFSRQNPFSKGKR
jgi:hypothetical protein